ncbi:MAG: histone deacetylase family protein [Pseudomonadota bacterium]
MLLYSHAVFGRHEVPPGHAERAERYGAVTAALAEDAFAGLERREAPIGDWAAIERAHAGLHAAAVKASAPQEGLVQLDADTFMGPHSLDAAMRAVGAACAAVDAVAGGEGDHAFCVTRPPGHHATPDKAMGFCVFNTVAVAAFHARAVHGLQRVAVVDFDVHHGNGTQDIFWDDADAFFASSHEWPQYPGTGTEDETGAHGNIANARLQTGTGSLAFRKAWETRLLPALDAFAPDIVFISAGFDAHEADPLGGLALAEDDYDWATREIAAVAKDRSGGRVVSCLEGGYDLAATASSAAAHVRALAETE